MFLHFSIYIFVYSQCSQTPFISFITVAATQEKRIVIVGGGPAGVHMSACLAAKGYKNVTLLEAEAEVGGKSLTMYDPSQPDVPHELGTCYMSPGYTLIRNLLDEYDKDIVTCNWKILEMM
jgi:phytoene dehydrogenase-like protein